MTPSGIAAELRVSPATVRSWRSRFERDRLANLGVVERGRGRKPSIPKDKIDAIVDATLHTTPPGETHWSCRSMAKAQGVSPATVQRVWSARGIQPHRVDTFKLSNDRRFEEKLVDVVGLYLSPPEKAVVLCMDEKSEIQALDRTEASLPMKRGRAQTMTHDYKRHGTTTFFAALDVLTGRVIGECLPRHRNTEFLRFLRRIDKEVPKDLAVHLILDNYGTHKHPNVEAWLAKHPHFHLTSRRRRARGSTSWSGGSTTSPTKHCAGGCSDRSPTSSAPSTPTSTPTTVTPNRSSGQPPPTRSSRRSGEGESPSKQSPANNETLH